ncbi:MAG TPA: hypothetical protein PLY87_31405 [Planctomycetaceae bacterium]|nr:hypothetical protein [Planctomycetaceae bacterium]
MLQSRVDRKADLEVRATTITLPVNLVASSEVTDLSVPSVMTLNVVEVREPNPPEGEVAIRSSLGVDKSVQAGSSQGSDMATLAGTIADPVGKRSGPATIDGESSFEECCL